MELTSKLIFCPKSYISDFETMKEQNLSSNEYVNEIGWKARREMKIEGEILG